MNDEDKIEEIFRLTQEQIGAALLRVIQANDKVTRRSRPKRELAIAQFNESENSDSIKEVQ